MVRTAVAVGVAGGLLWLLAILVGDPSRTGALTGLYPILGIVFLIELIWAISYTVWPRKHSASTL